MNRNLAGSDRILPLWAMILPEVDRKWPNITYIDCAMTGSSSEVTGFISIG